MNSRSISIQTLDAKSALVCHIYETPCRVNGLCDSGWAQFTIKSGVRSSSATSYLAPQFAERPNLHVLLNSRVSRILQTGSFQGVPSFRTVEIAKNGDVGAEPSLRVVIID